MKDIRKIFITALMLTLVYSPLMSQTFISGVVNNYTSIEELLFREGSEVSNAALVNSTLGFSIGDTVMIYQPKGFVVEEDAGDEGIISLSAQLRHVGKYTMLIIHDIDMDTIIFNNSTGFDFATIPNRQYKAGEVGQLIKVASYENAVVNGTLTAGEWDTVSNTGGVLALFVKEKLTLNAPIDVSGKGFKGGDPGLDEYTGSCYSDDSGGLDDFFYLPGALDKAGLKGEGAADTTFTYTRGKGSLINGGGGGNAKFSGGGGGSNFSPGGAGGNESDLCTSTPGITNGKAGYALGDDGEGIYTNSEADFGIYVNRIFMGGGGGSGTQHIGNGYPASRGGNGGGIVIIIADTLESSLVNPILAMGESVTTTVAGSGGGGGGGGCIVLDVSHYQGEIKLNAEGGDGGNTNGVDYTGPGGGGGGGAYWVRFDSTNLDRTNTAGQRGQWDEKTTGQAGEGQAAELVEDLNVPLNGFLFNTLPREKTVCSDETPDYINATYPKGGDKDSYVYEWYYKAVVETDWILDASNTGVSYSFSGPLSESTDYKRIVRSGSLVASDSITYTVLQKIVGNDILAPDTVCYGLPPIPLHQDPDSTLGGANVATDTTLLWIGTTNGTDWFDAPETNDKYSYAPSELFETITFARIAKSGVCDDTSNQVIVTVLEAIDENWISQDTILCYAQTPDELIGSMPSGGDVALFSFKWEVADDTLGLFTQVALTQNYPPPLLEESKYYRRVFYSGMQDACKDTTEILTIEVLPLIVSNDMITTEDTVCQDDAFPVPGILAEQPTGGREGVYTYIWQVSDDEVLWGDSTVMSSNDPFNLNAFPSKRYIRRLVKSGEDDVCQDYSDTLLVNVIPSIDGNTLLTADFKQCQDIELPIVNANLVSGGDLTYGILWQSSIDGINFSPATGINNQPDSYTPGALLTTSYYRREVWSSNDARKVCDTYSDTLKVTIKPRIEENYINEKDLTDSVCYNADLLVLGSNETTSPALTGGDDDIGLYSFKWQTSPTDNEGDFLDATVTSDNYTETGVTTLQYLRRLVTRGVCIDTSDVMEEFVRRLPNGMLALADGQDSIFCESDILPMEMKVNLDGEADVIDYDIKITYVSDEGTGTIDADDINTNPGIIEYFPSINNDFAGYVFTMNSIIDNKGCLAPIDSMSGTASITVYQTPESEILPMDTGVCGPIVSIEALADKGGVGHWILKSGNLGADFDPADSEITEVTTDLLTTELEVMKYGWVLETPRCRDTAFVEIVHYKDPDLSSYTLKTDTVKLYLQDWYDLSSQTNPPDVGVYEWKNIPTDEILGSDTVIIDDPFTFDDSQFYVFEYKLTNGVCEPPTDELTINRLNLKIYDGFSPDGDEYNNALAARGLDNADRFDCFIYNSWGTLVKKIDQSDLAELGMMPEFVGGSGEQIQILWKGSREDDETFVSSQDLVDDGTYFYSINIYMTENPSEEAFQLTGTIVLKRH